MEKKKIQQQPQQLKPAQKTVATTTAKKAPSAPAMPVTTADKIKYLKGLRIRPYNGRRDIYAEIKELRLSKADFNTMVQLVLGNAEITAEHAEWLTLAVEKEELRRVIAARL